MATVAQPSFKNADILGIYYLCLTSSDSGIVTRVRVMKRYARVEIFLLHYVICTFCFYDQIFKIIMLTDHSNLNALFDIYSDIGE